MRTSWWRGARWIVAIMMWGILLAAPAQADDEDTQPFREPGIRYLEYRKPYVEWVAGTVMVVAVLLVAFKNPHRSNQ